MRRAPKRLIAVVLAGVAVVAIGGSRLAIAEDVGLSDRDQAPCDAWDVEYATLATLGIRDTRLGAGDGDHPVGPGSLTLRFGNADGPKSGPVKMVAYSMREHFTVEAKALFWNTRVTTDATTIATGDACGVVAEGVLTKTRLGWSTKVRGYKTDGTLTCDGSMCGKFGAPPQGKSDHHSPPGDVAFASFDMSPDLKGFTMAASMVSQSRSPAQTSYLALAGREAKRTCVHAQPCKK